jgi:hypothetical protein
MGPIGGACCAADALFLPLENKLASKPATTACCCCNCDLYEGVLISGLGVVIMGLVEALTFLFIVPNGAIIGGPFLVFIVVLGKGVWSVYHREYAGSASHTHAHQHRERETHTATDRRAP